MKVLRYELALNDSGTQIEMGAHSHLLSVACKPGDMAPSLWVREPTAQQCEKRLRRFRVIGTGHEVAEEPGVRLDYVGTAIADGGGFALVWHVFEVVGVA